MSPGRSDSAWAPWRSTGCSPCGIPPSPRTRPGLCWRTATRPPPWSKGLPGESCPASRPFSSRATSSRPNHPSRTTAPGAATGTTTHTIAGAASRNWAGSRPPRPRRRFRSPSTKGSGAGPTGHGRGSRLPTSTRTPLRPATETPSPAGWVSNMPCRPASTTVPWPHSTPCSAWVAPAGSTCSSP